MCLVLKNMTFYIWFWKETLKDTAEGQQHGLKTLKIGLAREGKNKYTVEHCPYWSPTRNLYDRKIIEQNSAIQV